MSDYFWTNQAQPEGEKKVTDPWNGALWQLSYKKHSDLRHSPLHLLQEEDIMDGVISQILISDYIREEARAYAKNRAKLHRRAENCN